MSKVKIDISTHFLPDDHQVFVLHPGKRKKFYKEVLEQQAVFLDLPGFSLKKNVDIKSDDFHAALEMSAAVAKWHRLGADPDKKPSRDLANYKNEKAKKSTLKSRLVSEFEGLYFTARVGDLIVCPGDGYNSHVLIGEITKPFSPDFTAYSRHYPGEKIPARQVRWLSIQQKKAFYSDRLISLMQNPAALIRIYDLVERKEIYDVAYKDYTIGNEGVGRILIKNSHIDLKEFSQGMEVVSYFSALYHAKDIGQLADFLALPPKEAIEKFYNHTYFTDTSININSPGEIAQKAIKAALPSFIGIMLALAAMQVAPTDAAAADFVNSASGVPSGCQIEIAERVKEAMNMMHMDMWQEICAKRRAATDAIGMDTPTEVTVDGKSATVSGNAAPSTKPKVPKPNK